MHKWIDIETLNYIFKQPKAIQKDLINELSLSEDELKNEKIIYETKSVKLCE